ncbi:excinuclease ABC subunit UvrC [Cuneatibacter sp. NSJ-177]|uniref:excinuclease ABC subunit UvrC n=1 Tax=Cuneatibacter sp. NSJ-177 TaxID=2931401 RepID=UPI001FD2BE0A|nr:excinuclease ABC subunit UvrC [Cuneatibacter sp. NSJ-177]MCJ7833882.1 excinuclease ABC subunit UvrC [Cuneatibacter sp. NSJ-177]
MFDLKEELKKLPDKPGVYLMHDKGDHIIYVGKAVNLKNRVRQYFQNGGNKSPKILRMVSQIAWFEFIVTDSETEALVLECNLIKEHHPKYNTMLTDDKGYPFIRVTVEEAYPRILIARTMKKDKSKYYGPYTDVGAVKDSIRLVQKLYKIRTCRRNLPADTGKERPCLNYHIHQCDAPCQGYISEEEYREAIDKAQEFLKGNYGPVQKHLRAKMQEASDALDFENAMMYRELLFSVQRTEQQQKVTDSGQENRDIVALAMEGEDAIVQVFFIREGRLIGREHFHVKVAEGDEKSQVVSDFVKQFYSGTPFFPREIFVPEELPDGGLIERWLSAKSGHKISLVVPKRGEKHQLVELAEKNAKLILTQDREKVKREEARTMGAVHQLETLLGREGLHRMEAFDISNISGFESVGSMVVYENGRPKRNDYRKFKIQWVKGANDYASMEEVLTRRFSHGLEEVKMLREKGMEEDYGSFSQFPDLLLMDGGRGQVNVAERVLRGLGLSIPVCGMVKDENHRTRGLYFENKELPLDHHSEAFQLITRIQDEAHRFAITFHRARRGKAQIHSILDDIDGVGPVRRKALMREFKTIDAMKAASVDDIAALPEMNRGVAEMVYAFFHDGEVPLK